MKKLIFVLALLLFASPVLARVDITCEWTCVPCDGSGCYPSRWVNLYYQMSAGDSNLPRAFALDILTGNDANITEVNNISSDFWIHPGSMTFYEDGEINEPGTPVASPSKHPDTEPGLDFNGITIEMGSLHYPPEQASVNAPDSNGLLLSFRVDKSCTISVSTNATRTGLVLYDASSVAPNTVGVEVCACPADTQSDGWINLADMMNIYGKLSLNGGNPIPDGNDLYVLCQDTNCDDYVNLADMMNVYSRLAANGGNPIRTQCKDPAE